MRRENDKAHILVVKDREYSLNSRGGIILVGDVIESKFTVRTEGASPVISRIITR